MIIVALVDNKSPSSSSSPPSGPHRFLSEPSAAGRFIRSRLPYSEGISAIIMFSKEKRENSKQNQISGSEFSLSG